MSEKTAWRWGNCGDLEVHDGGIRVGADGEYEATIPPEQALEVARAIMARFAKTDDLAVPDGLKPIDAHIPWRGSVSDLITDVAFELYPHEFDELRRRLNDGEGAQKTKAYPPRGGKM
jgi:hypothetical protein